MNIIAAVSNNGVIGKNGKIPWRNREDLKKFKETTMGGSLIMGRLTFESIGRPLPGRRNIIISSRTKDQILSEMLREIASDAIEVYKSIKEALSKVEDRNQVWFAGGQKIYEEAMEIAEFIVLTLIDVNIPIEKDDHISRFPFISPLCWTESPVHDDSLNTVYYIRRKDQ